MSQTPDQLFVSLLGMKTKRLLYERVVLAQGVECGNLFWPHIGFLLLWIIKIVSSTIFFQMQRRAQTFLYRIASGHFRGLSVRGSPTYYVLMEILIPVPQSYPEFLS